MKKIILISICLLAFGATTLAVVYDETNFNALGRLYEPAPKGHKPGKDNGPGAGLHHPGENCSNCHTRGGEAESYLFTMSGTLYSDRAGRSVLKGGEVIMEDREGNIISMTSNPAGNFWTYASLASDPYTVSSYHGGPPFEKMYIEDEDGNLITPADPDDARTWKYKTWVRDGDSVRPMMTIAGVGGSETTQRMSCNMHHGGVLHRSGALWVGKAPTLPSYPASGLSYRKHIYPILRNNCSPCHIPGTTMTPVNTKTDLPESSYRTTVDYSGELDLMFYEGSTGKAGIQSVVHPSNPEASDLLLRTVSGGEPHGGGTFWDSTAPDYLAIKQWIVEGALKN
jgi:hypothetical protein